MKKHSLLTSIVASGFTLIMTLFPVYQASAQSEEPQLEQPQSTDSSGGGEEQNGAAAQAIAVQPLVFQAAGPTAESIQETVAAFRAALGEPNNGNTAGPLTVGRREINWDGGGANETADRPVKPFDVFLNSRGARFTTPGLGLSQAPPSGGPQGGLARVNPTYGDIFAPFSPLRLFTPVGSNITEALFFIPGTQGLAAGPTRATVRGFGAVFSDVDQQGSGPGRRAPSTIIEYFGADRTVVFSSFVPASPGDATFSFFGIVFVEPLIARVRITTGKTSLGPNEVGRRDVVVMDDFLYGEPQLPAVNVAD